MGDYAELCAAWEEGRAAGRAEGIREAMAIAQQIEGGLDRAPLLSKLQALLAPSPPPAATAECTCTLTWTFYSGSDAGRAAWNACPVHAPKPAAEKP